VTAETGNADTPQRPGAQQHGDSVAGLSGVLRGFGVLAAASVVGQSIGFLALIYVAHRIGVRGIGQYNFVFAIVSVFGLFGNLGLDTLAVRAIASGRDTRAITSEVLILKLTFAVVAFTALVAGRSLLTNDPVEQSLVPILGLNLLVWAVTLDWRVVAMRRFGALGSWRVIGQVAYGALVPVFVVAGAAGVRAYAWLNVVGLTVTMLGLAWVVVRQRPRMPAKPSLTSMGARLIAGLPFMYGLAMLQLYVNVDIVMLGSLRSALEVGVYAVANRLPSAVVVLANVWLNAFFPHAATEVVANPRSLLEQVGRLVTAMAVLGIGLVVGAALCAEGLITWLFGEQFASAGPPCVVLAAAAAVTLVDVTFGNVLQAAHGEGTFARAITFGVLVNVGANLILIPSHGALGAAISTLIAELALGVVLVVALTRRVGGVRPSWSRIMRGLAAAGLMAGCMLATRQFGAAISAVTGLVTFTGFAVALGAIDMNLATGPR
jgi:O-antigen/teichoic acid export membrane protein